MTSLLILCDYNFSTTCTQLLGMGKNIKNLKRIQGAFIKIIFLKTREQKDVVPQCNLCTVIHCQIRQIETIDCRWKMHSKQNNHVSYAAYASFHFIP